MTCVLHFPDMLIVAWLLLLRRWGDHMQHRQRGPGVNSMGLTNRQAIFQPRWWLNQSPQQNRKQRKACRYRPRDEGYYGGEGDAFGFVDETAARSLKSSESPLHSAVMARAHQELQPPPECIVGAQSTSQQCWMGWEVHPRRLRPWFVRRSIDRIDEFGFSTRWATVLTFAKQRAVLRSNASNSAQVTVRSVHSLKRLFYNPPLVVQKSITRAVPWLTVFNYIDGLLR